MLLDDGSELAEDLSPHSLELGLHLMIGVYDHQPHLFNEVSSQTLE